MPDLVCSRFPLPGQLGSVAAFLIRTTHDVLLVHGRLRLRGYPETLLGKAAHFLVRLSFRVDSI
jgi:hypothetical protein